MVKPVFIDWETKGIELRPKYPPEPVGVAIKYPGRKARYYAFGHPTKNNCTKSEAYAEAEKAFAQHSCEHNSKFDLDVSEEHVGIPWPDADMFEDTMILAYLDDPHNRNIDLKSLSVKYLNRPPSERDELKEWILANVKVNGKPVKPSKWGAHICDAPGDLVGKYACADVEMTAGIFDVLYEKVKAAGMLQAYHREKAVLKVLKDMEKYGIPVDAARLHKDCGIYDDLLNKVDDWIRKYLGADFDMDKKTQLANALEDSGKASNWALTPTGQRSTSKEAIRNAIDDETLVDMLDYRSTLANYVRNFMGPWVTMSLETGRIFTQWNSTKQEEGGGSRTGRLSSTPNLQNVPNDEKWAEANARFAKIYKKFKWLKPLPHVRGYIVAPEGWVFIDRDFSQQEPRVLAHFEDGALCEAYKENPRMDVYKFALKMIYEMTGIVLHADPDFARKMMKTIILAIMYGVGNGKLAIKLGVDVKEAVRFKKAILRALPGLKELTDDLKRRGQAGESMRTWGGRVYYAEPSRMINDQWRDFYYKLVNYLIQGSSADLTKEAMIRYARTTKHGVLLLQVHDQLTALVPVKYAKQEMKILKDAMDLLELDAPLVSDGSIGRNWGELEAYND